MKYRLYIFYFCFFCISFFSCGFCAKGPVDLTENRKYDCIFWAILEDDLDEFKKLINDPDFVMERNFTFECKISCVFEANNIFKYIVKNTKNWTYSKKLFLLKYVCRFGNKDLIKYLIQDSNFCIENDIEFLLKFSIFSKNKDILEYLINEFSVTSKIIDNKEKLKLLYKSCFYGLYDSVKCLVDKCKFPIDILDKKFNNLLHISCYFFNREKLDSYYKIITFLIRKVDDKKKFVNSLNNKGWSPFHAACANCSVEIVKFMIDEGEADIYKKSGSNESVISIAFKYGNSLVYNYLSTLYFYNNNEFIKPK
ncbi:ankyrin repeat domain-containing protein [Candidatus Babeliales bacterium]|nr:ankyrin repeat domain-containing protein [Candidatus Babeliales bacterium]